MNISGWCDERTLLSYARLFLTLWKLMTRVLIFSHGLVLGFTLFLFGEEVARGFPEGPLSGNSKSVSSVEESV